MAEPVAALIRELDAVKHRFGPRNRAVKRRILGALAGRPVRPATLLVRLHETLCFMRAYPDDVATLAAVEVALARMGGWVARILRNGPPAAARLVQESGIAGTVVSCPLSLATAQWLAGRFPGAVALDWDDEGTTEAVGALLPWLTPEAGEDTLVEVGVPVRAWLAADRDASSPGMLGWLLARAARRSAAAAVYDQVQPRLRWRLGESPGSRTHAKLPGRLAFFHRTPLRRRGGPLPRRLPGPPIAVRRVPLGEGTALRDAALAAVTVRYREVHGFTGADPGDVVVADAGRGTEIAWLGLRPAHRLPLRAHYGYLILKNGVPVGYGDASCLFDWCEIAFNVFETFRQGESGYLFTRLLGFLVQWLGIRVFHLGPYQLGHANEEALASGAFWFYYKLGFRPTRPALARLAREEAARIARHPGLRSSRQTLARLAAGRVTLGVGGRPPRAVREFDASLVARRAAAMTGARRTDRVARTLAAGPWRAWAAAERTAFARLAPILAAMPDLADWPAGDRRALMTVIRAKGGRSETEYLRRMRGHRRLRQALLTLGTRT